MSLRELLLMATIALALRIVRIRRLANAWRDEEFGGPGASEADLDSDRPDHRPKPATDRWEDPQIRRADVAGICVLLLLAICLLSKALDH